MPPDTPHQVKRTGRRPGDSGARDAILDAAGGLFAERGFDAVSMRAIAAAAGVDAALVHHYFGSKQQLFQGLVALPFDPSEVVPALLAPGVDGLGRRLVDFMLATLRDPDSSGSIIGLLRTATANPGAAGALREMYSQQLLEPLARAVDADRPLLRAALCSSQLLGLAMAEHVLGLDPLVTASHHSLVVIYGATLQTYLTGPLPPDDQRTADRPGAAPLSDRSAARARAVDLHEGTP